MSTDMRTDLIDKNLGSHSSLFKRMMADLQIGKCSNTNNPLADLAGNEIKDISIAMMDAWAVVGDIISFYSRYSMLEGYIDTASEDFSVTQLAKLVGYKPKPPISSSTLLAYRIDESIGKVAIPTGSQVMSIPEEEGELPQIFETSEVLEASSEKNQIELCPMEVQSEDAIIEKLICDSSKLSIWINGSDHSVQEGFPVIFFNKGILNVCVIDSIEINTELNITKLDLALQDSSSMTTTISFDDESLQILLFEGTARCFGYSAPPRDSFYTMAQSGTTSYIKDVNVIIENNNLVIGDEVTISGVNRAGVKNSFLAKISGINGNKLTIEGYIPNDEFQPDSIEIKGNNVVNLKNNYYKRYINFTEERSIGIDQLNGKYKNWDTSDFSIVENSLSGTGIEMYSDFDIYLKGHNHSIAKDSIIMIQSEWGEDIQFKPMDETGASPRSSIQENTPAEVKVGLFSQSSLYKVSNHEETSRDGFATTAEVTGIKLYQPQEDNLKGYCLKKTKVFVGCKEVCLSGVPLPETINLHNQSELIINSTDDCLFKNHDLISINAETVCGDEFNCVAEIEKAENEERGGYINITLANKDKLPDKALKRNTVRIGGNIVPATHGETVLDEILGDGNATQVNQSFRLTRSPQTHLLTEYGIKGSLSVRVNDILWNRVDSFIESGSQDRSYVESIESDGTIRITFGDGEKGLRLPTGSENVKATYRTGAGSVGNVKVGQIQVSRSNTLGIEAVTNPEPARSGLDNKSSSSTKKEISTNIVNFDRIVSLVDLRLYLVSMAGVGRAVITCDDGVMKAFIACSDPQEFDNDTIERIEMMLKNKCDFDIQVEGVVLNAVMVCIQLKIDDRYRFDIVSEVLKERILDHFSYANMEINSPIQSCQIEGVAHKVDGVVSVAVDPIEKNNPFEGIMYISNVEVTEARAEV